MPKNGGLEKGKHVRIASRMLGAKLIELYFRWNDRWVFLAVLFPEVKWRVQHDNIMNTYRALQILEAWNQVICQDYLHARMRDLAGYQPSDENRTSQPLCVGRHKVRLWEHLRYKDSCPQQRRLPCLGVDTDRFRGERVLIWIFFGFFTTRVYLPPLSVPWVPDLVSNHPVWSCKSLLRNNPYPWDPYWTIFEP